ncbi:MAG: zinc ribbon domain-containing protein [Acidobacteriota bacterium]
MYCPNCSAEALKDQKFCRSCGMELQAVAILLGAQSHIAKPDRPDEAFFHGRQRAMLVWGMILTLAAVAFGSSVKILQKEHIQLAGDFTPYLMVITLLIAFFGMGLMCYPFLQMISPKRRSSLAATPKPEPIGDPNSALLQGEPASVTEQTTEFLEATQLATKPRDTAPQAE